MRAASTILPVIPKLRILSVYCNSKAIAVHSQGVGLNAERYIFHITSCADWERGCAAGEYRPATFEQEGFVHCSNPQQVVRTANLYYRAQTGLILLQIDPSRTQYPVYYEGDSETFPHLYGPLAPDAVVRTFAFEPDADGLFTLPANIS